MMEKGEITLQKRQKRIEDNEEKNEAHKKEMHRQGYRNYSDVRQSGNERYVRVTWDGEQQDRQEYLQPTRTAQYSTHIHTGHTTLTNDI